MDGTNVGSGVVRTTDDGARTLSGVPEEPRLLGSRRVLRSAGEGALPAAGSTSGLAGVGRLLRGALRGQMQWRSHPVLIADSVEPGPCHTWSRDHSWTPGPGSTPERSYTVGRPGTSSPRDVSRGPVLLLQLRPGASFTSGSPWFHDRLMRGMCVRSRLFRECSRGEAPGWQLVSPNWWSAQWKAGAVSNGSDWPPGRVVRWIAGSCLAVAGALAWVQMMQAAGRGLSFEANSDAAIARAAAARPVGIAWSLALMGWRSRSPW